MITIVLLHPTKQTPIRTWKFQSEPVVRIGRSRSNDVVIGSAVVSRHHVELWRHGDRWEVVSFGANGTFMEGARIHQVPVVNGMIVHLGNSGPKLRLKLELSAQPVAEVPWDTVPASSEPHSYAIDSPEREGP